MSVVIPTRNRASLVLRAVACALEQRGVVVEVVVIDDHSDDDTAHVLRRLVDPRLTVHRMGLRSGVARARNAGIRLARGRYVAFLDDDDLWAPDKLQVQIEAAQDEGAAFVASSALQVDEQLRPMALLPVPPAEDLVQHLMRGNVIPAGSSNVIVERSLLMRVGGFDPRFHHSADWDLWIRLVRSAPGALVPIAHVAYVQHAGNATVRLRHSVLLDVLRVQLKDLRSNGLGHPRVRPRWGEMMEWMASEHRRANRPLLAAVAYAGAGLATRDRADATRTAHALKAWIRREQVGPPEGRGAQAPAWLHDLERRFT